MGAIPYNVHVQRTRTLRILADKESGHRRDIGFYSVTLRDLCKAERERSERLVRRATRLREAVREH